MKKFLIKHRVVILLTGLLLVWRIYLLVLETVKYSIPLRKGYLGFVSQSNFDGVFYTAISQYWYRGLDQAFFPLYPISIWVFSNIFVIKPSAAGIFVGVLCLFFMLLFLYKLMDVDHLKKYAFWSIIFYISFPTSFFLANIYTESIFLFLIILSFYLARKGNRVASALTASLATSTRVVGILILPSIAWEFYLQYKDQNRKFNLKSLFMYLWPIFLIPTGLFSYMIFLWYKYADPLLFVHIQPAFGAGRSGGDVILLPQLIFRYAKIFTSVPYASMTFWISALEFFMFIASLVLLYFAYINKIRKSYILFGLLVIIFPTLSGTLSSFPRYALASFPLFIYLGTIKNIPIKITFLIFGLIVEAILAVLFFRGYFVS